MMRAMANLGWSIFLQDSRQHLAACMGGLDKLYLPGLAHGLGALLSSPRFGDVQASYGIDRYKAEVYA